MKLQSEYNQVAAELAKASRANEPPPPPLDVARVETYLKDLRAVLSQEIPAAAAARRLLTGPIIVTQEPYPVKKHGAQWILRFTPNAMLLLRDVAVRLDYPDSNTLGPLSSGNWITTEPMVVKIDSAGWRNPRLESSTYDAIRKLISENPEMSNTEIARRVGCSSTTVFRHRHRHGAF